MPARAAWGVRYRGAPPPRAGQLPGYGVPITRARLRALLPGLGSGEAFRAPVTGPGPPLPHHVMRRHRHHAPPGVSHAVPHPPAADPPPDLAPPPGPPH